MSFPYKGVVDQFADGGALLKSASRIPRIVEIADATLPLNDDDYAMVVKTASETVRRFPTHDAGNTLVSALYFRRAEATLPDEIAKTARVHLNWKLEHYGLQPLPEREVEKVASAPPRERFPVKSAQQTVEAANFYEKYASQLPREQRAELATRVLQAAPVFDVMPGRRLVSETLNEWNEKLASHIEQRTEILRSWANTPEDADKLTRQLDALSKIASAKETEPGVTPEAVMHALETFDRRTALSTLWGRQLSEPWEAVYKQASVEVTPADQAIASEYWIRQSATSTTFLSALDELFGDDVEESWRADPVAAFESLIPTQRVLVRRMLDGLANGAA